MKKLNWGMIGGGKGSQIGPAHRLAAGLDGLYSFAAGALDHDPAAGRAFGQELGLAPERAYGESSRADRVDLVTVATPNATHYEISKAFLQAGFNVLCEKPMTVTEAEAEDLVLTARKAGRICAVNYGYTGYALVRHMRAMVARGDIGGVRLVVAEFAHGHHANAADMDNPRVRWRYDPAQAGVSAQFADCGIHALHMASFVTGQEVSTLSADFASCLPARVLEDDAMVNFRMSGGTVGRLWTSSVAIGRQHGLTIQVFGETGGLGQKPRHAVLGGRGLLWPAQKSDAGIAARDQRLRRHPPCGHIVNRCDRNIRHRSRAAKGMHHRDARLLEGPRKALRQM